MALTPRQQALLSAGASLMAQPYSRVPQSPLQGLGRAGSAGLNTYQNALLREQQMAMAGAQMQQQQDAINGLDFTALGIPPDQAQNLKSMMMLSPQAATQGILNLMKPQTPVNDPMLRHAQMIAMSEAQQGKIPQEQVASRTAQLLHEFRTAQRNPAMFENTRDKLAAERESKRYQDAYAAGQKATRIKDNLDAVVGVLQGVDGGPLTKIEIPLQQMMTQLGIDPAALGLSNDVAPLEMARAFENRLVLGFRNPAGGEGMPGHLSDRDVRFLQGMSPGVLMTERGRKLLYTIWRKKLDNQEKFANEYNRRVAANQGFPSATMSQEMAEWKQSAESGISFLLDNNGAPTDFAKQLAKDYNLAIDGMSAEEQAQSGALRIITSQAEWENLPPGTEYIFMGPDGQRRGTR